MEKGAIKIKVSPFFPHHNCLHLLFVCRRRGKNMQCRAEKPFV